MFNTPHFLTDETQTRELGAVLGRAAPLPGVIALCGDLGAGKTCLTQGLAEAFGVNDHLTSPTFTLLNEYSGQRGTLIHMDVYRLEQAHDLWEIGVEEYLLKPTTLVVVEWANKFPDFWPPETLWLTLSHRPVGREVTLSLPAGCGMLVKELEAFFSQPQKDTEHGSTSD